METLGTFLKAHREKRGIRLEEIASITKIHLHSLELLEAGKWAKLPPEPFIRGFITAYAKYVGLDSKEIIRRYLEEAQPESIGLNPPTETKQANPRPVTKPRTPQIPTPAPAPADVIENKRQFSVQQIGIGIGAVAVLILVLTVGYVGKQSTQPINTAATEITAEAPANSVAITSPTDPNQVAVNNVPAEVPATAPVAPTTDTRTVASTSSPAAVKTTTPAPVAEAPVAPSAAHEMVIESKERTWIKVVVDEEAPIEYFLPSNERATYKAQKKIKVVLGNSTGSKITHNGEVTPGTKFQGTIRSYIFPADAKFPQDIPAKKPASEPAAPPTETSSADKSDD